jgi:hypothetical protein
VDRVDPVAAVTEASAVVAVVSVDLAAAVAVVCPASPAWVPTANRFPSKAVQSVVKVVGVVVRRTSHGRRASRGWVPMGSRCRRVLGASASRSAPTRMASDPTELLGIPSAARSVRPSAMQRVVRAM